MTSRDLFPPPPTYAKTGTPVSIQFSLLSTPLGSAAHEESQGQVHLCPSGAYLAPILLPSFSLVTYPELVIGVTILLKPHSYLSVVYLSR